MSLGPLPALSDGITTLKTVTPTVIICEGEAFRDDFTMKMNRIKSLIRRDKTAVSLSLT